MDPEAIDERRQAIIERYGPWIAYNLKLGEGVYTIGPGRLGNAERNIARVTQLVSDAHGSSLAGARVLDLGSHEGGFGIEFALRGADVMCVEARDAHVQKTHFAKECLDLNRLQIVQADVRELDLRDYEPFDVVLCLGLLYHLPSKDLVPFLSKVAAASRRFALIETQIAIKPTTSFQANGRTYRGCLYQENPANRGAAIDAEDSFWLTQASLLNMLSDAGYSSVSEVLNPPVLEIAAFEDHVVMLAFRGERTVPVSIPDVGDLPQESWRWPERMERQVHPTQNRSLKSRLRPSRAVRKFVDVVRSKNETPR